MLLVALGVIAAAALLNVTPRADGVTLWGWRLPEMCAAKRMGGTCPGCGLTRSFVYGAHLDARAFTIHPLGPLLFTAVLFQLPYRSFHLLRARRLLAAGRKQEALERRAWPMFELALGFLGALFVVWVVRAWILPLL